MNHCTAIAAMIQLRVEKLARNIIERAFASTCYYVVDRSAKLDNIYNCLYTLLTLTLCWGHIAIRGYRGCRGYPRFGRLFHNDFARHSDTSSRFLPLRISLKYPHMYTRLHIKILAMYKVNWWIGIQYRASKGVFTILLYTHNLYAALARVHMHWINAGPAAGTLHS